MHSLEKQHLFVAEAIKINCLYNMAYLKHLSARPQHLSNTFYYKINLSRLIPHYETPNLRSSSQIPVQDLYLEP